MGRGWLEDIFNSVKGTKTNGTDGISAATEDKESIKMDKRKVIEEIMAIAAKPADEFKDGKEEQIKTIAGLAEKLAYNKSERGANDEDAAKDKDKAKDEDNPSKTDKDADKEAKKACDKADKAEDAMEARIAANFAKKAALYEKVSPFTGSFDHNPMTLSQMAKYACDKLGIKGVAEDGAQTALLACNAKKVIINSLFNLFLILVDNIRNFCAQISRSQHFNTRQPSQDCWYYLLIFADTALQKKLIF